MRVKFGLLILCLITGLLPSLLGWTPILRFPTDEGLWGYPRSSPDDYNPNQRLSPGESGVAFHGPFDATFARNPSHAYPNIVWDTPAFYGGYLLYSENNSNGNFLPNFVRTVGVSADGRGHFSLPVTEIIKSGTSGTLTNTVLGTLVTPTSIADDGEFRIMVLQKSFDHPQANGGLAEFRGAAFDGTRWLVTADAAATVPNTGVESVVISTRRGWHALNTDDFTYDPETVVPAGPFTQAGVWFMASESSSPAEAGFQFGISDAYFTSRTSPANYHPDANGDGALSLTELLAVIEIYNTRLGSQRTGRYDETLAPDRDHAASALALYDHYYAADTNRDGALSLTELLRVIEIYNVRDGTVRVGRYRMDAAADDGVAPNPNP